MDLHGLIAGVHFAPESLSRRGLGEDQDAGMITSEPPSPLPYQPTRVRYLEIFPIMGNKDAPVVGSIKQLLCF